MYESIIRQQLFAAALDMDPKAATYQVRISSSQVGVADTFENYTLDRVTFEPVTSDQLTLVQATVGDRFANWRIYQQDLIRAGEEVLPPLPQAPEPQPTFRLLIGSDIWIIEFIYVEAILQAFKCFCRIGH